MSPMFRVRRLDSKRPMSVCVTVAPSVGRGVSGQQAICNDIQYSVSLGVNRTQDRRFDVTWKTGDSDNCHYSSNNK